MNEAQLEKVISIIRTRGVFGGPFDNLVHFLKVKVDEITKWKKQLRSSNIHGGRVAAVLSQGCGRRDRGCGGGRKLQKHLTKEVKGKEIHNDNYSTDDFSNLTRERWKTVNELCNLAEEVAASTSDSMLIRLITKAVNAYIEEEIIGGVSHAATCNASRGYGSASLSVISVVEALSNPVAPGRRPNVGMLETFSLTRN